MELEMHLRNYPCACLVALHGFHDLPVWEHGQEPTSLVACKATPARGEHQNLEVVRWELKKCSPCSEHV